MRVYVNLSLKKRFANRLGFAGELIPERNKKRDIRNWHHTAEKYKEAFHTDFSANRGDIPIIHGDCDGKLVGPLQSYPTTQFSTLFVVSIMVENILKLLGELMKLVKELKEEVKGQRHEINYLRGLIENCAGCQQAQPLRENCQYSNPCFPGELRQYPRSW